MDKKYFLWLQKIANINDKLNFKYYNKYLLKNRKILEEIYNNKINSKIMDSLNIDNSIIDIFLDKNIKEEVGILYKNIIERGFEIITIDDEKYPRKLLEDDNSSLFCYITSSKINLNNKNIYMYFNDYYTKFARNLIKYFAKIIYEEKANIITEYNDKEIKKINVVASDMFECRNMKYDKKNYIILPNTNYLESFVLNIIDILIIIEARYEPNIVKITDELVNRNKDIYVVPSNIYNKNSYFSNYLIKQGADVILNKWDLKYILKSIIG